MMHEDDLRSAASDSRQTPQMHTANLYPAEDHKPSRQSAVLVIVGPALARIHYDEPARGQGPAVQGPARTLQDGHAED